MIFKWTWECLKSLGIQTKLKCELAKVGCQVGSLSSYRPRGISRLSIAAHRALLLHSCPCNQGRGISGMNGPHALWEYMPSIANGCFLQSLPFHARVLKPKRTSTTTRSPQRDTLWIGMSVNTVFFWGAAVGGNTCWKALKAYRQKACRFWCFQQVILEF